MCGSDGVRVSERRGGWEAGHMRLALYKTFICNYDSGSKWTCANAP